jgi:hypothetical protein
LTLEQLRNQRLSREARKGNDVRLELMQKSFLMSFAPAEKLFHYIFINRSGSSIMIRSVFFFLNKTPETGKGLIEMSQKGRVPAKFAMVYFDHCTLLSRCS